MGPARDDEPKWEGEARQGEEKAIGSRNRAGKLSILRRPSQLFPVRDNEGVGLVSTFEKCTAE